MGINYPNVINLDITSAKAQLKRSNIDNYKILYRDSKKSWGQVVEQSVQRDGSVILYVGTRSIINNLPSNYQNNVQLKNYLMIFQHFNNEFNYELDNIHNAFNPIKTKKEFLTWLSSWFSLEIGADLPQDRYRRLIREIVPLYRWRGTKEGLSRILEIISGYKPDIIEDYFYNNEDDTDSISFTFSELGHAENVIAISFPVSQETLGGRVVKTIFNIVDKEKPAHVSCRILFTSDVLDNKDDFFTIGEVSVLEDSRL